MTVFSSDGKEKSETGFKLMNTREIDFHCEKHGDVKASVYIFNGSESTPICPLCEKEELEKQKKLEEEQEITREKEKLYALYQQENIEKEYWDKSIDDIKPYTESQRQAVNAVKRLIERKKGKIVLLGGNGTGKTHLGSMAVKALGGFIYSMYEITTMIRQSYTIKAERSELEIVKELASAPMFVMDEIGRTKGSDAEMNWSSYFLDKRHTRDLPFMLLSNRHLARDCPNGKDGCEKCFERAFDNDVLSRLCEDTQIITINAPDHRAIGDKK